MRRPAPGRDLLDDGVGSDVSRRGVGAGIGGAVIVDEFFHIAVQQPPAQLVTERIPHDRVHADEARGQVADGEELHEFHVDQRGPGVQRQRIGFAAHIDRGAVAPVQPGQPARRQDHRAGGDGDRLSRGQVQRDCARDAPAMGNQRRHRQVADPGDAVGLRDPAAQGLCHGRAGIEEIDEDAARPVMARRHDLFQVPVLTCPADSPFVHFADPVRSLAAQQRGQLLVTQPAPGGQRVGMMAGPVIRRLFAHRHRDGHLRHDRRAAAPDQALVQQQHPCAAARRGYGGIHAGPARPDHQHVGFHMGDFGSHGRLSPSRGRDTARRRCRHAAPAHRSCPSSARSGSCRS